MKESIFTGQHIAQEIRNKSGEMHELSQAMDELDRDSLPWKLLNKEYETRMDEWQKLNTTRYVVQV